MYCWEAAKRSQVAITELLLFRKSTGAILRDALPALQRLCAYGPFEDCQVRMFVKQRALPSANVCEAASKKRLKHLLAAEKNIYTQAKIGQIST